MDAYVEVTKPDGTTERFPIEGAQVTLGKSGTAGISLPTAHDLELEHLLIAPRGKEGCWVSTSQGAVTPTKMKGKPFTNGMVPWNTDLVIGRFKVRITNKKPKARGAGGEGPSKVVLIGGGLAVALAAWTFLGADPAGVPSSAGIEPPSLFDGLDGTCPPDGATQEEAGKLEYRGHVRGDRYRYDPRDGIAAVGLYRQADACYRSLGEGQKATNVRTAGESMQREIDADYAARRLRLHHALEVDDWRTAVRESEELVGLTEHLRDHPYVDWLKQTLRIVRAKDRQAQAEPTKGG